ncbi:ArnT family glycosyltransferase [Nocardia acididurans]|uniref:ArnT family glycosyltransferase n=1 Tax=Nocardia acididurans TaxID=2802282 RepID=UPI001E3875F5|nr:glycosyltransferase family 39 protein [Nocardia acididurans]
MTATLADPRPVSPAPPDPEPRSARWEYLALAVLLLGTAAAYFWNLSASHWANPFYSAAVQAGSVSWKAFFFGSSDAGNSITVDKTPLSLWPMALSVRAFGLHSWSMLAPQVLMGVGSVALLWATVRRNFGAAAGLLAGLFLALTPVAALMFRFNNPDAMLVLFMVAAAWAMTRALADGRWRWLILTGLFIGLGFLAKQLQVLLVVPALAGTYLLAGPPTLGKRIAQLLAAGASVLVGAGWWVLVATLWPVDDRPYFGGSQHNSIIELTLGYNGFGRLTGNETGSVGPSHDAPAGGGGGNNILWGKAGAGRLFEPAQGGQIAWLIPAALILLATALLVRGRAARTDQQRASLLMWGGWLIVTGVVFSYMKGIFHQYYTVALAPAVAVLVAAGGAVLWREREKLWVRLALAVAMGTTTGIAWMLLSRSESFLPWLRWLVLVAGIAATVALLVHTAHKFALATGVLAVAVGLAGPAAYTVETLRTAHEGPIPSAGPSVHGMRPGGFGEFGGFGGANNETAGGTTDGGTGQPSGGSPATTAPATPPTTSAPANQPNCPPGPPPSGGPNDAPPNGLPSGAPPDGSNGAPPNGGPPGGLPANCVPGGGNPSGQPGNGGATAAPETTAPAAPETTAPTTNTGAPAQGGRGDGKGNNAGGVMMASRPSDRVNALLLAEGDRYTWVAATISANSAAGFQLATELPVMPIGGFNGTDPSPTLAQFQKYVEEGRIHYFIGGDQGGMRPGADTGTLQSTLITNWVKEHYTAQEVDGVTLYDLTQPKS